MPSLDWSAFDNLSGSKSLNFENLCRGLIRLSFGRFGQFKALSNQPGVEFHIKLSNSCSLGAPPRWFGWQCKCHTRIQSGNLAASSKKDIEESLRTTEKVLPNITDWVLWTPYTLSAKDQSWFYSLSTSMKLHLWSEEELDTYLSGDGLILRSTYFAELILSPEELKKRHVESIQPIRERWLEPVHQSVEAERIIRRMLGEPDSWEEIIEVGQRLEKVVDIITNSDDVTSSTIEKTINPFVTACSTFANTLLHFHKILEDGDLDIIQQILAEQKLLINKQIISIPRRLRTWGLSISLSATNALADMRAAQKLLDEIEKYYEVGLIAILADAGGGKTQIAAQITSQQKNRPAGVLLHGRDLHRGETLDNLASHFLINGNPLTSMENLLAALDAAGKRSGCRLPIIIDGLNEAENPKDWKATLAILSETVKSYPNVLVVCTLRTGERQRKHWEQSQTNARESFAVMALPDGVKKIKSEGFGGDTEDAIEKYFKHFKINSGDAEIPVEFLQHPLNLRIFCQVTNPNHDSEVKIDHFPSSLSPLFEKYVTSASERIIQMPNLSYSYSDNEVELAIYKLGLELWNVNKREVDEINYREALSDTSRQWDSSIVNLLAQEGIIFRNPGVEPGTYVITPVYDALGGYIIANSLLRKYITDREFEWLDKEEVISLFNGDDSHELAYDIFVALVALTPRRMNGSNFWEKVPDIFKSAALKLTINIDPQYIDDNTVLSLLDLFENNKKERLNMFSYLQGTRGTDNHPLNSLFLDSALRSLHVSERDLTWTEWIRDTRAERFNDLLAIEKRWKNNLSIRTTSDQLRAKYIMWLLSSSDHEFRDIATRTLYWYGCGTPWLLFNETLSSLSINDPYVPERMLAASYGVAMAHHVNLKDQSFISTTLPEFARRLYDSMFVKGAPYSTTHSLMREYASRIIELAILHNPTKFSQEEVNRSSAPFADEGIQKWKESETLKKEDHRLHSPFEMDFENYSIGSLVPGRGNYNYEHEGYIKIRTQILWRVEELGWTSELFKDIDSSIANGQYSARMGSDQNKTDRYGKKYSWIAFHEMSGLLNDQGVLDSWRERTSAVDIDPSFPERVANEIIIEQDFLGNAGMDMQEWIINGSMPEVDEYLKLQKLQDIEGPWITLDGYFTQQDESRGRSLFCFIRSFFVSTKDIESFEKYLAKQDLGGRWLPEKPSVIYTFAGEIPWCSTYPMNELEEFSFKSNERIIKTKKTKEELYLDEKKLNISPTDLKLWRMFGNEIVKSEQNITDEDIERIEVRETVIEVDEMMKEYKKINAQIPVCDFGWEGYQSVASDAGHATVLSKEIADDLNLVGQPQTFDLFSVNGEKVTFNIKDQRDDFKNTQNMFFIKESTLTEYLNKNDLTMIWAVWGEREYSSNQVEKLFHGPDRPEHPYKVFSTVKRYE